MEAPEKIYLQICGDCNDNDCKNCEFEDLEDNVTWCRGKIFEKDIEYICTDTFIEKACDAYCKVCGHYAHSVPTHICRHDCRYFSDFKKYMEE